MLPVAPAPALALALTLAPGCADPEAQPPGWEDASARVAHDGPVAAPGPAPIQVRLALNWFPEPEFGGFYEGVLGGHYDRAGFDVEIIPGGPGAPTLELLGSGRAEAAITSADDLLVKRSKGVQAIGAWPAFQWTPVGLLAHASTGLSRIDELGERDGLTIAMEVGGPFQQWLWKTRGWEGKVPVVPTSGSLGSFLTDPTHVQQAYVTSEPCVARGKGADVVFLQASEAGWNPYGTLLAFADPPPEWAPRFVRVTEAAWKAYVADPSRANAAIVEANDQLDAALVDCITAAQAPYLSGDDGLGAMTDERWRQTVDTLVTVGLLKQDASAEGAWIGPTGTPVATPGQDAAAP
ncbi:MAG: ABC transporter substrate-binding protein [Alphaproteobacteria bacterium]|nr:ABC transporter substrate-binding protein [Alphaproteobacteria bacterium]